jgi:hypothetical protein
MTYTRREKFDRFQRDVLEQLSETNRLLEKVCALLVSDQLLQECVSPSGEARAAEECAEIVNESFCAGMCLSEELNSHAQSFSYQKSEFFIDGQDEEEDDDNEEVDDEDDDEDDDDRTSNFSMAF